MAKRFVDVDKTTADGKLHYIPAYTVKDIICSNGRSGISITVWEANTTIEFPGPSLSYTVKTDLAKDAIVANLSKEGVLITLIKFANGNIYNIHPIGKVVSMVDSEEEEEEDLHISCKC